MTSNDFFYKRYWRGEGNVWLLLFFYLSLMYNGAVSWLDLLSLKFVWFPLMYNFPFSFGTFVCFVLLLMIMLYLFWLSVSFWRSSSRLVSVSKKFFVRVLFFFIVFLSVHFTCLNLKVPEEVLGGVVQNEFYGSKRLPTEEEWKKVVLGMSKNEVMEHIPLSPSVVIYERGCPKWLYYHEKISSEDDLHLSLDGKAFFVIYFDQEMRVSDKEVDSFDFYEKE